MEGGQRLSHLLDRAVSRRDGEGFVQELQSREKLFGGSNQGLCDAAKIREEYQPLGIGSREKKLVKSGVLQEQYVQEE